MGQTGLEISAGRSRLALGLLLLIDALTFVSLGEQAGRLEIGLTAGVFPIAMLCIDVLLAPGLFTARRWAQELARYRCIIGVCYLAFLWISFFMLLDNQETLSIPRLIGAAAVRDGVIGFTLTVILFVIREQKKPVVPKTAPTAEDAADAPPGKPEA